MKFPRVPAPKVTMAVGLILLWLVFQKTKAGNARKCYASSPTILVVLKRLTNEVVNNKSNVAYRYTGALVGAIVITGDIVGFGVEGTIKK